MCYVPGVRFSECTNSQFEKQNASLEEILWELKEKTQLVFMYSDEDIASVKGIDIDMKIRR